MADTWTIINQKENTIISPTGQGFDDVWTISFRVTAGAAKGTVGTISVPEEEHTADFVKQAIDDKVAALNEVAAL